MGLAVLLCISVTNCHTDDFHMCLKLDVVHQHVSILHTTTFLSQNPGRLPSAPSNVSDIFQPASEAMSL
jgi:hypothetical protein